MDRAKQIEEECVKKARAKEKGLHSWLPRQQRQGQGQGTRSFHGRVELNGDTKAMNRTGHNNRLFISLPRFFAFYPVQSLVHTPQQQEWKQHGMS